MLPQVIAPIDIVPFAIGGRHHVVRFVQPGGPHHHFVGLARLGIRLDDAIGGVLGPPAVAFSVACRAVHEVAGEGHAGEMRPCLRGRIEAVGAAVGSAPDLPERVDIDGRELPTPHVERRREHFERFRSWIQTSQRAVAAVEPDDAAAVFVIECERRMFWPFFTLKPVTWPVVVLTLKSVMSAGPLSRVPHALPASSARTSWIHRAPSEAVGHPSDQSLPSFHARSVRAPASGMSYSVTTTRVASPVGRGCKLELQRR